MEDEPTDNFLSFLKADSKKLIQRLKKIFRKRKGGDRK